jgi:hypothetical protein
MRDELRCRHCGDLIGVYEPLIMLADGRAQETSRLAHPHPLSAAELCFHRGCYPEGAVPAVTRL